MKVGKRAQGQEHLAKVCVIRHGRSGKRGLNAQEKAFETQVRQGARREIETWAQFA
jgi:hypothetical protein